VIGPILGVWEVTRRVRQAIASDPYLAGIGVRGQIANFKRHSSGHLYFTLRDDRASLRCVMFRSRALGLEFAPEDGMQALAFGYVDVYERDGSYQLYVDTMRQDGIGALHAAAEQLKKKMEAEGLMDAARKRQLPFLPRKVGVVTSRTGAAVHDILSVAKRRFPPCRIVLAPVLVQGEAAAGTIVAALRELGKTPEVDVIIVARGGGGQEDLLPFNDERVVRAIYGSPVAVVSAVGHEIDATLSDLVADVRAATPSAAAEIVFPSAKDIALRLQSLRLRARSAVDYRIERASHDLTALKSRPPLYRPLQHTLTLRQRVDGLEMRAVNSARKTFSKKESMFSALRGKVTVLDPSSPLKRGYSMCVKMPEETLITSVDMISGGDGISIVLKDGRIGARVSDTEKLPDGAAMQTDI
jgi:exodeoxyribonuclease VII large subunit